MDKKVEKHTNEFAPVVSVLGHVDHGKTTLLDKIRETSVAEREHGGITQRIGASQIQIEHEGKLRKITFIDTPGHEAFANMRSQGVSASDIALLIIAADDGIKPQTKESIEKIKEAKLPYIVVFTKIDLETANVEKIKQEVLKEGIALEGLGGDVPYVGVSAKTDKNLGDLLDLILLVYDLSGIKKDKNLDFMGVIIDSKLDKRRGIVASLVVKQGSLSIQKNIFSNVGQIGRVRAIIGTDGKNINTAIPGYAVELLGLTEAVPSGTVIFDQQLNLTKPAETKITAPTLQDFTKFLQGEDASELPIILKSQTTAEMEAIKNSLPDKIKIIAAGQGDIGVSDILMAKDFRALVLGFNVDITREARQLGEVEKVFYKSYRVIYEMLDELNQLISAVSAAPSKREIGRGQILASFMGSSGPILGVKVTFGRLAVGDKVKIMRGEREMGQAQIISIKKGKQDIKLAEKNSECGIQVEPEVDFAPGDAIMAYSKTSN